MAGMVWPTLGVGGSGRYAGWVGEWVVRWMDWFHPPLVPQGIKAGFVFPEVAAMLRRLVGHTSDIFFISDFGFIALRL